MSNRLSGWGLAALAAFLAAAAPAPAQTNTPAEASGPGVCPRDNAVIVRKLSSRIASTSV